MKTKQKKSIPSFLILLFSFLTSQVTTGQIIHSLTIQFESNTFELSQKAEVKIDSLLKHMSNKPKAYAVYIIGHTDDTGNKATNENLSVKRASETAKYFEENGFLKGKISVIGKGLSSPIADNSNEKGKAKNRRVEIAIRISTPNLEEIGGIKIKDDRYVIKADKGGIIEHPTGTKIKIPPNAFVNEQGENISGDIHIKYRDYRDPVDFIFGNIPMSYMHNSDLYHFNSAGMFKIMAYNNGKSIYLKEGEQIKFDFVVTEDLANLNFYRFDIKKNQWKEIAKLTGQNQSDFGIDYAGISPCGHINGERECMMTECEGLYYSIKTGVLYAESENKILGERSKKNKENIKTNAPLRDEISKHQQKLKANNITKDTLMQHISSDKRYYQLKTIKRKKNKVIFRLYCNADGLNEIASFNDVFWELNLKKETLHDSVFRTKWNQCEVLSSPEKNRYDLKLHLEETVITIHNLEITLQEKIKKRSQEEFTNELFEQYDITTKAYRTVTDSINAINTINTDLEKEIQILNTQIIYNDSLNKLLSSDSLFCFWQKSKPYMTKEETKLEMEQWFSYFEKNKAEMRQRYTNLQTDSNYTYCKTLVAQQAIMRKNLQETNEIESESDQILGNTINTISITQPALIKSLSISNLGIYNCDQIIKERNPIEIFAQYEDSEGNQIEPLLIYLIDNSRNGIIKYDGTMGYSPYRFKYNPISTNTIIAMDENKVVYLISPEQIKAIKQKNKTTIHTFTLEAIKNVKSKAELKKML